VPGIAIGAHLFGFAGGVLVGVVFDQFDRRRLPRVASLGACAVLAVVAFVAAVAVA
jgi:membrane associated rhomboid family serine protease